MEKTKINGKLAIGIILVILGTGLITISIFSFVSWSGGYINLTSDLNTQLVSGEWVTEHFDGYFHDYSTSNTLDGIYYILLAILFISVGGVLISQYTAYKKESDKQKMEKMIEERYGMKSSIPTSKPHIVHCNECSSEIECFENQQIIRCPQCGKAYKNPYYKEK